MVCFTATTVLALFLLTVQAFPSSLHFWKSRHAAASLSLTSNDDNDNNGELTGASTRRNFVQGLTVALVGLLPSTAHAGIDVSGLTVQGGGGGNPTLQQQLQAYDGSAATRVQQIKSQPTSPPLSPAPLLAPAAPPPGVATWAQSAAPATLQSIRMNTWTRYQGQVVSPQGPMARNLLVTLEFPSDWLALDRATGCIQYVDQRNGDKVYLLRLTLPADMTLATMPKAALADALFDARGSLVRTGQPVEDYKAMGFQLLSQEENCRDCPTHRRLKIKYATVTGNGLRVERRGLVDAHQIPETSDVYLCLTSSNANKFEQGGRERETVEAIVDSFRIERY